MSAERGWSTRAGMISLLGLGAVVSCGPALEPSSPEPPRATGSATAVANVAPEATSAADAGPSEPEVARHPLHDPNPEGPGAARANLGSGDKPEPRKAAAKIPDAGPPPANPAPPGRRILGELGATEQAQLWSLLGAVCATREVTVDAKRKRGCACCPPFDECPPGTKPSPDDDQLLELRSAPRGSFSAAGRIQMAMTFWGCESHADNYGGTLIVEQAAKGWKQVGYRSGLNAVCEAYPRKGRNDLLLCLWYDAHQGSAFYRVDVVDLSVPELDKGWTQLVEARDNEAEACFAGIDDFPVVHHRIDHVELCDLDRDGKLDLVVPVRATKGRADGRYRAACTAAMDPTATKAVAPAKLLPKPIDVKLTFRFDGERFVPMGSTVALQRWLHQESDAFYSAVDP